VRGKLSRVLSAGIACGIAAYSSASAQVAENDPPACFDAVISARPVHQIPSEMPECDCIIMQWPWFVDLQIDRVLKGKAEKGTVSALAMMHTYIDSDNSKFWGLRRNTAGGFNATFILKRPTVCATNSKAVEPYLQVQAGQTMEELRSAGEKRYGKR
jgi:hypothetical protein